MKKENFRLATQNEVRNIKQGDKFHAAVYNTETHQYDDIHEFIASGDATFSRLWSVRVDGFVRDTEGNEIQIAVTCFDEDYIYIKKEVIE